MVLNILLLVLNNPVQVLSVYVESFKLEQIKDTESCGQTATAQWLLACPRLTPAPIQSWS